MTDNHADDASGSDGVRDRYLVGPVERALQVLNIVGRNRAGISLADLAVETSMAKSTVFRYLRTLLDSDFVTHDQANDTYRLGRAIWRLSYHSGENQFIQQIILPAMSKLFERFNETINFGVVDGMNVLYLEIIESSRSLRMQAALGGRDPLHSTALGKALLAAMPGDSWLRLVPARLPAITSATLRSRAELSDEIETTRTRGYAVERGENESGAVCVGAAILGSDGGALGAMSMSAPAIRMPPELEAEAGAAVRDAARWCTDAIVAR